MSWPIRSPLKKIFSFHFNQLNVSSTKIRIHQGALSQSVCPRNLESHMTLQGVENSARKKKKTKRLNRASIVEKVKTKKVIAAATIGSLGDPNKHTC